MKIKRYIIFIPIIFIIILYFSCADSGVNPFAIPEGTLKLQLYHLQPLNKNVDGLYEAWLVIDSSNARLYSSLGVFNVDANNNPVDANGQPMSFKYTGDTNNLNYASHCSISIATNGIHDNFLNEPCLLDVQLTHYDDSLAGKLTIGGSLALDIVGRQLMDNHGTQGMDGYPGQFLMHSRTSNNPDDCQKSIWFCDMNGNSTLLYGYQLSALPANGLWVFEGWVEDNGSAGGPYYYTMGRFTDPGLKDWDSVGSCCGPDSTNGFDKPGQEWIKPNCPAGKPPITNLRSGNYEVFISIEPKTKTGGNSPFFFKILDCSRIDPGTTCDQVDPGFGWLNSPYRSGKGPYATVWIKYNNHFSRVSH